MVYFRPPRLANTSIAIPAVQTNTPVLTPLGVGSRFRIVNVRFALTTAVAAGTLVQGQWQDNLGSDNWYFAINWTGSPYVVFHFDYPGFQLGDNRGLNVLVVGSAAGGALRVMVEYYIDTTT